jgi:hypothetical protein
MVWLRRMLHGCAMVLLVGLGASACSGPGGGGPGLDLGVPDAPSTSDGPGGPPPPDPTADGMPCTYTTTSSSCDCSYDFCDPDVCDTCCDDTTTTHSGVYCGGVCQDSCGPVGSDGGVSFDDGVPPDVASDSSGGGGPDLAPPDMAVGQDRTGGGGPDGVASDGPGQDLSSCGPPPVYNCYPDPSSGVLPCGIARVCCLSPGCDAADPYTGAGAVSNCQNPVPASGYSAQCTAPAVQLCVSDGECGTGYTCDPVNYYCVQQ